MFNMEKVGRRIAQLRKEHDMTQTELADRLGVSFQAVSGWERGASMPDISRLPEIAKLFGVTVDDLLGERSEIIESIVEEKLDDYLEKGDVKKEELSAAAPILKPAQVNKIFVKMFSGDIGDVEELLPYLPQDVVDQLLRKAARGEEYDSIEEIATYASEEAITEIAIEMTEKGESVEDFAIHIPQGTMDEIARMLADDRNYDELENIAIHVSETALSEIAVRMTERGDSIEDIAIYLSQETVDKVVRMLAEKKNYGDIEDIAIHASGDVLKEVIAGGVRSGGSFSEVKELFEYLDSDDLGDMFRGMVE